MPRFRGRWTLLALSGLLVMAGLTDSRGRTAVPGPSVSWPTYGPSSRGTVTPATAPTKASAGKLRLDDKGDAFAEHDGGRPFVAGSVDSSEALRRILSDDPEERMPPGKADKRLSAEQVDILRRWVEQGAKWESHWAFEAPVKASAPAVDDPSWPRNSIDRFVLARLEREGLAPSPEADRYALIRRVSLDLTGLPPTPEAVARFVDDPSPEAYDHLVDRLLRSPAFGERLGETVARPGPLRRYLRLREGPPGDRSGVTATGSLTRSTPTCPTTDLPSSSSPATSSPARTPINSSPPPSTATRSSTTKGGPTTRSSGSPR